ncbi:MAG: helix-turn-helix transcriptional regulator, partial [Clostridia bacterium]|nr:helix-turn-helix transcriptional regulator [Clostridia bacterium]
KLYFHLYKVDSINEYVYSYNIIFELELFLRISKHIKLLCIANEISIAELARRVGQSPQSFNGKLKRESFTIEELDAIAEAVNGVFERSFILSNGDKV